MSCTEQTAMRIARAAERLRPGELSTPITPKAALDPTEHDEMDELFVGGIGDVVGLLRGDDGDDSTARTYTVTTVGTRLPYDFRRILAEGTTASGLIAIKSRRR